ncbi:hypothetical protein AV521_24070 [Streptomyces sp. IMTB 2501]|uniref:hypothetical protein n=1 Tax=Streptomyces sp. IMTB 2501 TaxID=1776340 RepID=UPI00097004CB|nr:hypothetical protein [Streptomyces sp. IMTB 2501]OLZ67446.1 hypothetical protein AV521_24070 [Streptomyces sp. IMTB 2501]
MTTYNYGDHGPLGHGHGTPDLETLTLVADRLTEALRAEYPGLTGHGQVILDALAESADDGLPPNRGRIRTALEAVAIAASAGTGSLTFTRQLMHAFDL